MKPFKYYIGLVLILVTIATSCSKFLDIVPSTTTVNPTTIKDFKEMLNNDSLGNCNLLLLDLMSDDVQLSNTTLNVSNNRYRNAYLWNATIWNAADIDAIYNGAYTRILQMNVILDRLPGVSSSDTLNTPENQALVRSQAMLNRAWYYFILTNTYGKAYSTTAATDLAIPLVTSPSASSQPSRNTVAELYAFMVSDIRSALNTKYLPNIGSDVLHPGKAAGYGLISRIYLFEGNYDSARIYADSALAINSTLLNYYTNQSNAGIKPTQTHDLVNNPEVIWGHVSTDENFYALFISSVNASQSLKNGIGNTTSATFKSTIGSTYLNYDYRYYLKMAYGAGNYYISTLATGNAGLCMDNSLSVPELMLIKAECLARAGKFTDAATQLNTLRQNRVYYYSRYVGGGYNPFPPTYTADNILSYVLAERRTELFLHGGLRWFDLKRLNLDNNQKVDLTRVDSSNSVIATLPAGSNRYLLPFTSTTLANNANIIQNQRN